jgi:hypothetical protein
LNNSGQIFGGSGGDGDTYGGLGGRAVLVGATAQNVVIVNSGFIQGGAGGYGNQEAAPGATGVSIHAANGADLTNKGKIQGGQGGDSDGAIGGDGGYGVYAGYSGTIANSGVIVGGTAGYGFTGGSNGGYGGTGLEAKVYAKVSNTGTIAGGKGGGGTGQFGPSQTGGNGGLGVFMGGTLVNAGLITGGDGAYGATDGGNGGFGLDLYGIVTNTGVITGGNGGAFGSEGAEGGGVQGGGGVGVFIQAGVLTNAGTIAGGAGGAYGHGYGNGQAGFAVYMATSATLSATLIVDPGAVFNSWVFAGTPAEDTLELAGTTAATLTGIGTQFEDFIHISIAAGAEWDIQGTTAGLAHGQTITGFAAGDAIKITNAAAASGTVTVTKNGIVTIKDGSQTLTLDIAGAKKGETDFKFAKDTLTKTAAKMAFISPPAQPAASSPAMLLPSAPSASGVPAAAPVTTISAVSFGGLVLHDSGQEKWLIPAVTLTA